MSSPGKDTSETDPTLDWAWSRYNDLSRDEYITLGDAISQPGADDAAAEEAVTSKTVRTSAVWMIERDLHPTQTAPEFCVVCISEATLRCPMFAICLKQVAIPYTDPTLIASTGPEMLVATCWRR